MSPPRLKGAARDVILQTEEVEVIEEAELTLAL